MMMVAALPMKRGHPSTGFGWERIGPPDDFECKV
jgi:hypothetical protein